MTIRVLVTDDQAMIRGALAGLLNLEHDIKVAARAADDTQALEELAYVASTGDPAHRGTLVDVVITDVEMSCMDGITATQAIRSRFPGVCVFIVMTFGHPGYLQRALDAGTTGFMVKDTPVEALADGVRTVAAGGHTIDQSLALEALSAGSSPPTDREADVLREVEGGGTVTDIAHSLGPSQGTVRSHVSSPMLKVDARMRAEAASLARTTGWL